MSTDNGYDDSLRALLREGDPADAGSELSHEESANLRRLVLNAVRPIRQTRWFPIAAIVTAAVLVAVLLPPNNVSTPTDSPHAPSQVAEDDTPDAPRQIRFATEKGTQIIWV
ncbi:MAG: hypothetical protein OES47_13125, partial [Acidobacteriota bacterium]|nr:hypothetical protein [Acidobacteriota bacterium]